MAPKKLQTTKWLLTLLLTLPLTLLLLLLTPRLTLLLLTLKLLLSNFKRCANNKSRPWAAFFMSRSNVLPTIL